MQVADDFWLIARDDRSGRSRLHPRGLGLGLASGLLAELVLVGFVDVYQGEVYRLRFDSAPQDAVAHQTLARLGSAPQQHELRDWLAFLADSAGAVVTERLMWAGRVRPAAARLRLRQRQVFVAVDGNDAAWPEARLVYGLTEQRRMTEADAVLAGLVAATGLLGQVLYLPETRAVGAAHLSRVLAALRPGLRELLACCEAMAGDAVLTAH